MFWNKKKILPSLILIFTLASASLALSDSWASKADMPTARRCTPAAVLDGKIYIIGGNPPQTGGFKTVEVYDPATDTWIEKSPMPTTRGGMGVSVVNGKIYAIGGMTHPSGAFNIVEEYDPATDTWTRKSPMPTRRFQLSTSVVNGKIYAIGGSGSWPNITSKVEEYDPSADVWRRKADMPTARPFLATSVLNGRLYAIGGAAPDPDGAPVSIVEEYDPRTNTWTRKADLPGARGHLAAGTMNGKIYAIGGTNGAFPWPVVSTVEEYDPGLPPPDLNGDGSVDIKDLLKLVESWGQDDPAIDLAPPLGDGIVDEQDLELMMSCWQQEPNDPTLIAHWALDEADSFFAYDSAGTNDSFVTGMPEWQPESGMVNGAILLDGVDDFVITNPVPNFAAGSFSAVGWIKGGAPGQVVLSQMGVADWLCTDMSDGTLMTELQSTGQDGCLLCSEAVITDGEWHRVGMVWNGLYRRLYVDGIMVAEDTQENLQGSESGLYIGTGKLMQPGSYFSGLIDDIRIYNRAVSP